MPTTRSSILSLALMLVSLVASPSWTSELAPKVIYGIDNRADVYQVQDPNWRQIARSTAALVRRKDISLVPSSSSQFKLNTSSYASTYKLCAGEPFREQVTAAFCSGFLIGPDLALTAGHCIRSQTDCNETSLVFDFAVLDPGVQPELFSIDNIYQCKDIVHTEVDSAGADFALIRLDRPTPDRIPLKLRSSGTPSPGDELVSIGHPAGIPTKLAGGGIVRAIKNGFLVASLDTYGGNSGSAVLHAKTMEVEGILVRGEVDYSWQGSCRVSNQCPQDGCRGEDVTLISSVLATIKGSNN